MATGTPEDPWTLKTPPGRSEFQAWRDETLDPPAPPPVAFANLP